MPKNTIQFQKGLSLKHFNELYGTEDQCRQYLFRYSWPQGFLCPKCGSEKHSLVKTRNTYQCSNCRYQASFISGTIFNSTKLPLVSWFLAIYFITQSNDDISSLNFSRILGISANAALRVKHKLQQVMKTVDDSFPLSYIVQLDEAYWGEQKHDGNRGRGASGKVPFLAAVSTNIQGHPLFMRLSRIGSFSASEIKNWSLKHLDPQSIVISDGLLGFNGLAHAGISHESVVTGGGYKSMEITAFKWVNTMLGNVKRSLHATYHALSQKHLPRYLAEFCYRFNRRFNLAKMVGSLARSAINSKPITQSKLKLAEKWW